MTRRPVARRCRRAVAAVRSSCSFASAFCAPASFIVLLYAASASFFLTALLLFLFCSPYTALAPALFSLPSPAHFLISKKIRMFSSAPLLVRGVPSARVRVLACPLVFYFLLQRKISRTPTVARKASGLF